MQNLETNRVENKEKLNDDFEQEVIAFLNYREGGIIYVGINKNGEVVGVQNVDLTQLQIKDRIKNNIQPSTLGLFDVTVEIMENKEVIKVIISSGTEKPYYLRKKGRIPEGCYIRVGSSKERMTERMIDNMYAKIEYFGRKEQEKIDSTALKEAVINAIVHNDYSYGNSPIIELYSDRVEITSAGGLPQELSQEEFLEGVTAPRNKELIRVFKDVDLIENIGSGVLRILEAYDKSCFKFMEHFLRVSFKYKENPFEYDSKNKVSTNDTINDTIKLTKNERDILNSIIRNNQITREEIVSVTNISDRTVSRIIKHLQEEKIIERKGSKKTGYWKLLI